MQIYDIIIKPYFTEKTYTIRNKSKKEVISFLVNKKANKHQIRLAFSQIYKDVQIDKINTINYKPVSIKTGSSRNSYSKAYKVAFITLKEGQTVALSQDEIKEATKESSEVKEVKEVKEEKTSSKK